MKVFGVIAVFILIILIDIPSILKETSGKVKCLGAYGLIIALGFTISFLQIIDQAPSSPAVVIKNIVNRIIGGT